MHLLEAVSYGFAIEEKCWEFHARLKKNNLSSYFLKPGFILESKTTISVIKITENKVTCFLCAPLPLVSFLLRLGISAGLEPGQLVMKLTTEMTSLDRLSSLKNDVKFMRSVHSKRVVFPWRLHFPSFFFFSFPFPGLSCHSAVLRNKINRNVIPTVNCRFCRRRCVYTREQRIGGREETGGTACKKRENGKNGTDNIWASFQRTLRDKQ